MTFATEMTKKQLVKHIPDSSTKYTKKQLITKPKVYLLNLVYKSHSSLPKH